MCGCGRVVCRGVGQIGVDRFSDVTDVGGVGGMWGVSFVRLARLRRDVPLQHLDRHRIANPSAQRQQQDRKGQDQNTHGSILGSDQ